MAVALPGAIAFGALSTVVFLPWWLWPLSVAAFAFMMQDAVARYRDYYAVYRELWSCGFPTSRSAHEIARGCRASRCQRLAFRAAALRAGYSNSQVSWLFSSLGVRWWHFMPRGFPGCLAKKSFYRKTLGL